jgi:hypothetical protein
MKGGSELTTGKTQPATPAEVREWARSQGFPVGTRGRVSDQINAAFREATGRAVK